MFCTIFQLKSIAKHCRIKNSSKTSPSGEIALNPVRTSELSINFKSMCKIAYLIMHILLFLCNYQTTIFMRRMLKQQGVTDGTCTSLQVYFWIRWTAFITYQPDLHSGYGKSGRTSLSQTAQFIILAKKVGQTVRWLKRKIWTGIGEPLVTHSCG